MPTWTADIEPRIRSRLAEVTATGFWTRDDLVRYYNNGVQAQHRMAFKALTEQEQATKGWGVGYESDYARQFLATASGTLTIGRQDYPLPSDFWRMARVVVGLSPPLQAINIHFSDDYLARLGGRHAPSHRRPLYTLLPSVGVSQVRFYVAPGDRGVPINSAPYTIHYWKAPVRVDMAASPPVDVELADPFNDAPVAWACFEAMTKERTDGSIFRDEFSMIVATLGFGHGPEVK